MKTKLLKYLALSLMWPTTLHADNLGLLAGYYSIDSKTSTSEGSLADFGHFQLFFDISVGDHLEITPGYSLYVLNADVGDLGYGFDVSVNYFPISLNRPARVSSPGLNYSSTERIRPSVGMSFHQRQYQSIQSIYAGLGANISVQYQWTPQYFVEPSLTIMKLGGPLEASIQELGFSLAFVLVTGT